FPAPLRAADAIRVRTERRARRARGADLLRREPRGTAAGGASLLPRAQRPARRLSLDRAFHRYSRLVVLSRPRKGKRQPLAGPSRDAGSGLPDPLAPCFGINSVIHAHGPASLQVLSRLRGLKRRAIAF